jgi:ribokinase
LCVNEIEAKILLTILKGDLPREFDAKCVISMLKDYLPCTDLLLTLGDQGSLGYFPESQELIQIPARSTPVVDTTGAGDAYFGYYLASRCQGLSYKASMNRASLAATLAVTKKGALQSIPSQEMLHNFKDDLFRLSYDL